MMSNLKYVVFSIMSMAVISGCYYDVEEELYPSNGSASCDTANVTYNLKVMPIIQNYCYRCHSTATSSSLGNNIILEGYGNLKTYADNGRLIGAITHAPGFSPMPKGAAKMSTCDIATIQEWINLGTANN